MYAMHGLIVCLYAKFINLGFRPPPVSLMFYFCSIKKRTEIFYLLRVKKKINAITPAMMLGILIMMLLATLRGAMPLVSATALIPNDMRPNSALNPRIGNPNTIRINDSIKGTEIRNVSRDKNPSPQLALRIPGTFSTSLIAITI